MNHLDHDDIPFALETKAGNAEYKATFNGDRVEFVAATREATLITSRGKAIPLSVFFQKEPPAILFEQDTFIEDNMLFVVHGERVGPYNREQIEVWKWAGINLSIESQGDNKRTDSIQRHVIDKLCSDPSWELIFDDDASGDPPQFLLLN